MKRSSPATEPPESERRGAGNAESGPGASGVGSARIGSARVWPGSVWPSRVWHGLLAGVVLAALIIQVVVTATDPKDLGPGAVVQVDPGSVRFIRTFSYFTIQSNIILLAAALTLAWRPVRDGRFWRVLRLDALLGIIITGLVFETILAASAHPKGASWWSNLGFHYIAPWAALIGWLLFGPRPRIDAKTIAWAFVWPAAWIGYTLAHGAATGWYPYGFCDVGQIGYAATLRNLGFVAVLALIFAILLRLLDTRLPVPGDSHLPAPGGTGLPALGDSHLPVPGDTRLPAPGDGG